MPKTTRDSLRLPSERRLASRGSKADRKGGVDHQESDFAAEDSRAEDRCEMLEVQGFDLLAQIEAMLRHAREYQREVQRFRGHLGKGQTHTSDMRPLAAVRHHIDHMHEAYASFGETLTDTQRIVDSFKSPEGRGMSRS